MRLLSVNLFSIFALAPRPAVWPLLAVSSGIGVAKRSQIPDDMYYEMYALRDRYSMDQVPLQIRGTIHIVESKGKKSVHKKLKIEFARRFYTFNVTVRAILKKNHKNFRNFTGISVKLSVSHMRNFTVVLFDFDGLIVKIETWWHA